MLNKALYISKQPFFFFFFFEAARRPDRVIVFDPRIISGRAVTHDIAEYKAIGEGCQ